MRLVRTRRGARLVHGSSVLSELLREPGPTNSVFDVFAAMTAVHAERTPVRRLAMLGFAGGGTVAPLRAAGFDGLIEAVDMDVSGVKLFKEYCGDWVGSVRVDESEAAAWLGRKRGKFDVILEDLSVNLEDDVGKPEVSFTRLPALIASRLGRNGVAVLNALPSMQMDRPELIGKLAAPWRTGVQVVFHEWVNRFVIVGARIGNAKTLEPKIRRVLRGIGSEMAEKFRLEPYER
ncbi:MAG: hypothetical protein ACJ790_03750 [Myxococcaceae bacterium]